MASPSLAFLRQRPARAFGRPLSSLPRRLRLALLIGYRSVLNFFHHQGVSWSAAIAFWLVLSLPPLLIALSSMTGQFLGQDTARSILAEQIGSQLPAEGWLIEDIVAEEVSLVSLAGLGSLVLLLFSASRVFGALVTAINVMWKHVEVESLLKRTLKRGLLLAATGALLLSSVGLQLGIAGSEADGPSLGEVLARYILPFLLVVGGLFLLYRLVPNGGVNWRMALLGALAAAVALRLAQFGFWFLLTEYLDFDTAYGPLAGIAVLMTWAVIASAIVLLGAELVATLDRHRIRQLPLPSGRTGEA
jgi:membrane protein